MTHVHAFTDDALGTQDATGIASSIAAGTVSATDVMEATLARIETVNPHLDALTFLDVERARARAGRLDAGLQGADHGAPSAFLRGVPTAFKDNVLVARTPMRQGSPAVSAAFRTQDDPIVRQMLDTGLIPVGTTTMPPFGWTASTEFQDRRCTKNPWNTQKIAGGSSGGAAALVASGALPIAHGNDGGGSIRIPAAVCGLVGLKPTRGRLRGSKLTASTPVNIVTDSVLTRTVRDTVRFFEAAEAAHAPTKRLPRIAISPEYDRPCSPLRIGVMYDSPFATIDDDTRRAVTQTATLLEQLGHTVEPFDIDIPETFQQDFIDYWGLLAYQVASRGRRLFGPGFDPTQLDPFTCGLADMGKRRLRYAPTYLTRLRRSASQYARSFVMGPDVVISPVLGHVTPDVGWLAAELPYDEHLKRVLAYCCFTPLHNASGAPAMSLPLAESSAGMPIGVMFSAAHGDENTLLRLALDVERAAGFRRLGA